MDIVSRARGIFDVVIVAITDNPRKKPIIPIEERENLLRDVVAGLSGVEVARFSGLLVEFVKEVKASVIIRGLRAVSDFEYELQMALMNRDLGNVDTIFFAASPEYSFLSSSILKEIVLAGGDIRRFVPKCFADALVRYLRKGGIANQKGERVSGSNAPQVD